MYNFVNEFLGRAFKKNLTKDEYGVKSKCTTMKIPNKIW